MTSVYAKFLVTRYKRALVVCIQHSHYYLSVPSTPMHSDMGISSTTRQTVNHLTLPSSLIIKVFEVEKSRKELRLMVFHAYTGM